ncbi:hypothetical protein AWB72_05451 [Caballeronia concitans]|uniref:Uncharacterized protein n=1 Tax=Caballeronia concitans TaxID=1777133 RepID=A0A658R5D6_9BURK|nr:hypothetical protein AWB72_05451 [Caballeronia concitans]
MPVLGTSASRPDNTDSAVTDWSADPEDWGYFLSQINARWTALILSSKHSPASAVIKDALPHVASNSGSSNVCK